MSSSPSSSRPPAMPQQQPPHRFAGTIIIDDRPLAREMAVTYSKPCENNGTITFFTDGSGAINPSGGSWVSAAIVWRDPPTSPNWKELGWALLDDHKSTDAEMFALGWALDIALKEYCRPDADPSRIVVFTDSESSLHALRRPTHELDNWNHRNVGNARNYAASLQRLGKEVELRWVPAHEDVEGNERADLVATRHRPDRVYPDVYPLQCGRKKGKKSKKKHKKAKKAKHLGRGRKTARTVLEKMRRNRSGKKLRIRMANRMKSLEVEEGEIIEDWVDEGTDPMDGWETANEEDQAQGG